MKPLKSQHERRTLLQVRKSNNGHIYSRADSSSEGDNGDDDENGNGNNHDADINSSSNTHSTITASDEEYMVEPVGVKTANGSAGGGGSHNNKKKKKLKNRIFLQLPSKRNHGTFHIHRSVRRLFYLVLCALLPFLFIIFLFSLSFYPSMPLRHMPLADWGYNTSRNIADYVLPDNDTTLIEPQNACSEKVFLMIIVCSSMHNFVARQTVRESWGNTSEFTYESFQHLHEHLSRQYLPPLKTRLKYYREYLNPANDTAITTTTDAQKQKDTKIQPIVRILFLIGRNKYESLMGNETIARIRQEAQQYNDIIQENFIDSYNNLTLKTVLALKWFNRNCLHKVAFLMKCDDDTFVNLPNLIHFLLGGTLPIYNDTLNFYDANTAQPLLAKSRLNATSDYLVGHLFCHPHPIADVNSKWYMPYYMYPNETYPKYLSGAGYLMSADVVPRLYETALNTSFIHLEDVYLTGIVAKRAGIRPHHHPLFGYTRPKEWCSFRGSITQHDMKDDSLMEAYTFVRNLSNECVPPGKYFKRIRLRKPHACA